MKVCSKCKQQKDLSLFCKNKCSCDGLRSECKECSQKHRSLNKESKRAYNQTEKGKLVHLNAGKKYCKTDKGKLARIKLKMRCPEKFKARGAVAHALRNGTLVKQFCKVCGELKVEAHHYLGYEEEHWLDIEWLCKKHHVEADKILLR